MLRLFCYPRGYRVSELSRLGDSAKKYLGNELLDGKQEGHTLTTGHLHRDCGIIDAVLLCEFHIAAAVDIEFSTDLRCTAQTP